MHYSEPQRRQTLRRTRRTYLKRQELDEENEKSRSELSLSSDQKQRPLECPRAVDRLPLCRNRQVLLLRMLVSDLCMLVGVLAVLVSRRSMYFRLVMLTLVVMVGRFKVVMGCCVVVSGSSVVMLT